MIARRFLVEGRVQGVFFRDWAVAEACAIGLTGWVRNLQDGSVELLAIGGEDAVARLADRLHDGSPASRVDRVTTEPAEHEPLDGFERRATPRG